MTFKEVVSANKGVIFFLLRFLVVFAGLSLAYGAWIQSYGDIPDPISWFIADTLAWLNQPHVRLEAAVGTPAILLYYDEKQVISVFDGCNGIAVMILFFAFIIAFRGSAVNTLWFTVAGILFIHMANIGRLQLLLSLAKEDNAELFHFMHKYLFTLIIYVSVFILWVIWIRFFALIRKRRNE